MTLTTGTLYLVGAGQPVTSSIQYELEGVTDGIGLLEAITLSGEAFNSMRDFAGYSACSETIPSVPTGVSASWAGTPSGLIRVYFTKPANAVGIDCQDSVNNSTWANFYMGYTLSSPLSATNGCANIYYRVRAYNCAGSGSYSSGVLASGTC